MARFSRFTQQRQLSKKLTRPPTNFPIEIIRTITDMVQHNDPDKVLAMILSISTRPPLCAWADAVRESYYHDVHIARTSSSGGVTLLLAVDSTELNPKLWQNVHCLRIT